MPRKRKIKIAEDLKEPDYIPMKSQDVRQTVEVPVKQIDRKSLQKIEKPGRKIPKKSGKLVKGEYILIITEKPQAAQKIADALGKNNKVSNKDRTSYYELQRGGKKIVVAAAVGHLLGLEQEKGQKGWPIFKLEWKPSYSKKKAEFTKKYYNLLAKLCKQASEFIIATDYDVEGEVIGLNIVRFICKKDDAKRMKFSSLTKQEIENAYDSASPTLNWGQAIAGETRHYLDWLYGINLSRALMGAIKTTGSFRIMSIGRVQGPALHLIVDRELKIKSFKPEPYWQPFITITPGKVELKYEKDITKKSELDKFKKLKGKKGIAETKTTEQHISPPAPFNLTNLQTEAYKFFGLNPSKTLQIAQALYLAGLISYPRTSSQKIPETIFPKKILERLSKHFDTKLCTRDRPVEGKKSDPAHPSIYPTGEFKGLAGDEKKIYELIVRRFLAVFCEDAIVENKRITCVVEDLKFSTRGQIIKKKAWMEVYNAKLKETKLPDVNGEVKVDKVRIEEKETQPPKRFTQASLITELEKRNLGTKATRASIIETLYNRQYVKEQSIQATPLGIELIESLKKNVPIIIDEKLTRHFEKEMESITTAKKNLKDKQKEILGEVEKSITKLSEDFKKKEKKIGKDLLKATTHLINDLKKENTLCPCPVCKKGSLAITYSRKTKRNFIACNAYPDCKTTFSLPPGGMIKKTDKNCEKCGFPLLMRLMKGRRPWIFCFNPDCETNKEWQKKREEYAKNNKKEDLNK
ncbi:MAG: DNA topoisomerase I [archaeon]